ncbi:MAG: PaaI family thioesterase [Gemmatimonadota bacterium]|nr:MAG: PaaI family thioesterase [Gemmatimonadota bacterium]
MKAFQDYYDEATSHCYGCGTLNEHGLHIQSHWEGDEAVCRFEPKPFHTAIPGYVYGGLIASLIDCHGTGTAAAAGYREEGREMGTEPALRYVTASLKVDYLKPTPIEAGLEIRARVASIEGRKVTVTMSLYAAEQECARGEVIAVRMSDDWGR